MQKITGVTTPITTPFNDDLSFNSELYMEHAKWLLDNGIDYISPFGTTGEALSMSIAERLDAVDTLITSGIDPGVIMPGTGLCNFPETVTLCRHAVDRGCFAVMILPPFFFKNMSDEGLFQYFSLLIERVNHPDLKICLYHIPHLAGIGFSTALSARLATTFPDVVVAYKDSSGDFDNTKSIIDTASSIAVFPGSERFLTIGWENGARGCISATCNLNPKGISTVYHAIISEDKNIEQLDKMMVSFRDLLEGYALVPMIKAVLAKCKGQPVWANVRPPLLPANQKDVTELLQLLGQNHQEVLQLVG